MATPFQFGNVPALPSPRVAGGLGTDVSQGLQSFVQSLLARRQVAAEEALRRVQEQTSQQSLEEQRQQTELSKQRFQAIKDAQAQKLAEEEALKVARKQFVEASSLIESGQLTPEQLATDPRFEALRNSTLGSNLSATLLERSQSATDLEKRLQNALTIAGLRTAQKEPSPKQITLDNLAQEVAIGASSVAPGEQFFAGDLAKAVLENNPELSKAEVKNAVLRGFREAQGKNGLGGQQIGPALNLGTQEEFKQQKTAAFQAKLQNAGVTDPSVTETATAEFLNGEDEQSVIKKAVKAQQRSRAIGSRPATIPESTFETLNKSIERSKARTNRQQLQEFISSLNRS